MGEVGRAAIRMFSSRKVEVVPGPWSASLTSECKIFQQKSVPDIVAAVLGDTSEITLSKKITGSHSPWDYCVQYRETDLAFVRRLCRQG